MKTLFFAFFTLLSIQLLAQSNEYSIADKQSDQLEESLFSLDLLAPGFTYEKALSSNNSFLIGFNAGFYFYAYDNSNGESGSSFLSVPVLTAQYRHYYNFEKRNEQWKNTWWNTANYVGFNVSYQGNPIAGDTDDFIYEPGALIGPIWGIQRNGALTFNLYFGLGYYTGTAEITTIGNMKVGINLSKLTRSED